MTELNGNNDDFLQELEDDLDRMSLSDQAETLKEKIRCAKYDLYVARELMARLAAGADVLKKDEAATLLKVFWQDTQDLLAWLISNFARRGRTELEYLDLLYNALVPRERPFEVGGRAYSLYDRIHLYQHCLRLGDEALAKVFKGSTEGVSPALRDCLEDVRKYVLKHPADEIHGLSDDPDRST